MNLEKFYEQAYVWILRIGPRVLAGLLLLIIGLWLIRVLRGWMNRRLNRHQVVSSLRPFMVSLVVTTFQVLLFIAVMQVVGLRMTVFATMLGAFGVAAGLALSGTLQNFTSGVLILFLRPFKVGDIVIAQGQEGTIASIQIFFTVMKTYDNRTVIIPNSRLSNEVIVNLSREGRRRIDFELKFPFATDFKKVEPVISGIIETDQHVLQEPARRIGISTIEPDGYKVLISVWASTKAYIDTKLMLMQRVLDTLKEEGIV